MLLSVIIPAHNEEKYIEHAITSVHQAAQRCSSDVEIIVVANRCSDSTAILAKEMGALVIANEHKNISATKNIGVKKSQGEVIITMDADSLMHCDLLSTIERLAESGTYIGGQAPIKYNRNSLGIFCLTLMINTHLYLKGYTGGFYWCTRAAFTELNGFDESLRHREDIDFAKRLRLLCKSRSRKYAILSKAPFTTSSRKFDTFGDWHYLRSIFWGSLGKEHKMIKGVENFEDGYFYEYKK